MGSEVLSEDLQNEIQLPSIEKEWKSQVAELQNKMLKNSLILTKSEEEVTAIITTLDDNDLQVSMTLGRGFIVKDKIYDSLNSLLINESTSAQISFGNELSAKLGMLAS